MTNSHSISGHNTHSAHSLRGYTGLLVLCLSVFVSSAHAKGLTRAQEASARTLADSASWQAPASPRRYHPLGLQTLSVEKQERKNQPDVRWALVYQYHYIYREARLLVVDLDDASIEKQQRIESVHLPLNSEEIAFAQSLVLQDSTVLQRLHAEQYSRGQPPTSDLSDLDIKASIFEPMSPLHDCHRQRCALLSMFDQSRTVFAVEPVVLLGTRQVRLLDQP